MQLYFLPPLAASVIFLFFAILVLINDRSNARNITYSLTCFFTFIWQMSTFLMLVLGSVHTVVLFGKVIYSAVFLILISYSHFTCSYLELKNYRPGIYAGYAATLLLMAPLWKSNAIITGVNEYPWGLYPKAGPLHPLIASIIILIVAAAIILTCRKMLTNKNDYSRYNQDKYLILGVLLYSMSALDMIGNYGIPLYPIGFIPMLLGMALMGYAIVRHRLLDINIAIRKGILYSCLISILALMCTLPALILEHHFRGMVGYTSLPVSLVTVSLLVLMFQPLKNRLQSMIDLHFFRGSIEEIERENLLLRDELEKTEKLKAIATLAAGMAHEIKNPLTSIKTFTEFVDKKKNNRSFMEKFNRIVPAEVDRINYTVKQLLEFSRPTPPQLKGQNINSLINDTLDLLNNDLIKNGISAKTQLRDTPPILIDRHQIKQVLLNLFLNAMDAMDGSKRTLTIETISSDRYVKILISDTGKGIPCKNIQRVFDPFFTTKDKGAGLGLSVVHGIVKRHNGRITPIRSAEGTTFELDLPIAATPQV